VLGCTGKAGKRLRGPSDGKGGNGVFLGPCLGKNTTQRQGTAKGVKKGPSASDPWKEFGERGLCLFERGGKQNKETGEGPLAEEG